MITTRFEVNTDPSLIDADWEDFAELHNRHYGLAIDYIKETVTGVSHANKVMDLVVGSQGFYTQSKHFPAAFYGDMGEAACHFISETQAQAIAWEATALYRAGEAQSLTCIYGANNGDVFFGYRFGELERYELGLLQSHLPLHLRVMIDAPAPVEALEHSHGVLVYQRTLGGKHLLLRAPGRRQPFPVVAGFSE